MIIFYTEGGGQIGLGHISRCLALAIAIKKISDKRIVFYINDELNSIVEDEGFEYLNYGSIFDFNSILPLKPKIIMFDSYKGTKSLIDELNRFSKVCLFDDNNDIYESIGTDMVINGNIHAELLNYHEIVNKSTLLLLGLKYLVMKPEYWDVEIDGGEYSEGILITTGGSDFHNIIPKFIKYLQELDVKLKIIVGPFFTDDQIKYLKTLKACNIELIIMPKSLKRYILSSKLVISASGSTVYEILRLRRLPLLYSVGEDQNMIANTLEKYDVQYLGWWKDIDWGSLAKDVDICMRQNNSVINEVWEKFDGKGAERVAKSVMELIGE